MIKSREEIYLNYKGAVLYETIGDLISSLKEIMFRKEIKQAIYKKVLMIMIEALENIFKYNEFFENDKISRKYPPTLCIKLINDSFYIECTNPVRNIDADLLKKRIDEINSLDKIGIKEKYKETITDGKFSDKGGAGLGIIEMAKITDNKLDYTFTTINKKFSNFQLILSVKATET